MMGLLSEVEQKDPTILLNGLEGDIDSLLDYYIKGVLNSISFLS